MQTLRPEHDVKLLAFVWEDMMQSPAMTFMMYAIGAYYAIPVVAMMLFTMIFGIVYVAMLAIYWIQRR